MIDVIRTWKWPIPIEPTSLPADIPFMYCRRHVRAEDLVPSCYEGETVYLCPHCGDVYSVDREAKLSDKLRVWPRLYRQPYHWNYLHEETLAYAYIHSREGIRRHPFLAQHCAEAEQDAADLLIRYFIHIADESAGNPFFLNSAKIASVESDDSLELIIKSGNRSNFWPMVDIWANDGYHFFGRRQTASR